MNATAHLVHPPGMPGFHIKRVGETGLYALSIEHERGDLEEVAFGSMTLLVRLQDKLERFYAMTIMMKREGWRLVPPMCSDEMAAQAAHNSLLSRESVQEAYMLALAAAPRVEGLK